MFRDNPGRSIERERMLNALAQELVADDEKERAIRRLGFLKRQPKLSGSQLEEMRSLRRGLIIVGGKRR